jgi:uncharacterized protein (TIGR00369 family)
VADFEPRNPDYAEDVRQSFARQGVMATIGARLGDIRPGYCEVHLPFDDGLTQQDGYFHGGMICAIGDSAAGYAAMTLALPDSRVLTVEYKFNFMAPADGERLVARGRVIKAGRALAVCESDVFVFKGRAETRCAASLQTLIYIDTPAV